MAKPKPLDPNAIATAAAGAQFRSESIEARPVRSKRGLTTEESSQICFRIEKERHRAVKIHCVQNGLEVGEFLDDLLRKSGF